MRIAALFRSHLPSVALLAATACAAPTDIPLPGLDWVRLNPIEGLPGRPFGIAMAPNGALFVTQQDLSTVTRVHAGDRGARTVSTVGADPGDVVVTADGATAIASTFFGGDLHFLDAATGDSTDFTEIGSNAYRLMLSRAGSQVFVTTTGGKVFAVGVANGEKSDSVQLAGSLQGIARRSDGYIAVSSTAGHVTILDPATLDVITGRALAATVQDIVFSKDGSELFVALESAPRVLVLDGVTLATRDTIFFTGAVPVTPFGLALSPDGATLVVSSAIRGSVAVVDANTHTVRKSVFVGGRPRRIVFAANGAVAYVANEIGRVDLIR